MKADIGYFYFIKDDFFDIVDDPELMQNKENGNRRPCYYCIKSDEYESIMWFIPVSTKVKKYKEIYEHKIKKQMEQGKNISIDTQVFSIFIVGHGQGTYSNGFRVTLI